MSERLKTWAMRGLIAFAGFIVFLDWTLPSSITLFIDEAALFAIVCAMKWIHSK